MALAPAFGALLLVIGPTLGYVPTARQRNCITVQTAPSSIVDHSTASLGCRRILLDAMASLGIAAAFVQAPYRSTAVEAGGVLARPGIGDSKYGSVGKMFEYVAEIQKLRSSVASVNISDKKNVKSKREEVKLAVSQAIEPLIDAMLLNDLPLELPASVVARARALPLEVKGHLAELNFFVKDPTGFNLYKGKYKGGHVERELEEILDSADEYISLAARF
jgi:hypothetical protein